MVDFDKVGFIRRIELKANIEVDYREYPFVIPAVRNLGQLKIHPKVTYFVGENGSGKSTLIEAIAIAAQFNPEGGSKDFHFSTRRTESSLEEVMQIVRGVKREKDGFFLRAESLYNVASEIQNIAEDKDSGDGGRIYSSYGGQSLHERSHGESFLDLFKHRFRGHGLYILDEPEAALSVSRQFALLSLIDRHVQTLGSQFILATHSPILLAYPDSIIYKLDETGIRKIKYEEAESVDLTLDFMNNREAYLKELVPECYKRCVIEK